MMSDDKGSNNNNESLDSSESNKTKRLMKQKQITLAKDAIVETKIEFERLPRYTVGHKKNQHIKILDNVKVHNYWNNISSKKSRYASIFLRLPLAQKLIPKLNKSYGRIQNI